MGKVLFAGSFNPYTIGHHSVYENACQIFDNDVVHIGITQNPNKNEINPHAIKWITNAAFRSFESKNVVIVDEPLLVNFATNHNYKCLVRSFRNSIDLVQEESLATWNKTLSGISTVYVPLDKCLDHVSSSAIRSIESLGESMIDYFVNPFHYQRWITKKPKRVIVTGRIGSGKSSFLEDYDSEFYQYFYSPIVDMDQVVKNKMTDETSEVFRKFFEQTPIDLFRAHWETRPILDKPKGEVETIINDALDWGGAKGVYEISAFTSYELEHYYSDSIIVYVNNYDNGKQREIDHQHMLKSLQLQDVPHIVDFVIDLAAQGKDGVDAVVNNIIATLGDE